MPINTYQCPSCSARINYAVELGNHGIQHVMCPRCGEEGDIDFADLPERVRQTVEELETSNAAFKEDMKDSFDDVEVQDDVENTIDKVEGAFKTAKAALSTFDDKLDIDTDINAIADQYAPRESAYTRPTASIESDTPESAPSEKKTVKERLKQWTQDKVSDYAKGKLARKWGASEEEIDEVFSLATALKERASSFGYSGVGDYIRENPSIVSSEIEAFIDDDALASQLSKMKDSTLGELIVDALDK